MTELSPGIAGGCFDLLRLANTYPTPLHDLPSLFARNYGASPARVTDTLTSLGWIRADDAGIAVLSAKGTQILSLDHYHLQLRQAILDQVELKRPAWIMNTISGRLRTIQFCPDPVGQLLSEALVTTGYGKDVVDFWDQIASLARGVRGVNLNEIGRKGERLTLALEKYRTGREPKWIAVENNADGYDVLSIVSPDDKRALQIEVKTSMLGVNGAFHVTRNEWDQSELMENHCFHLWDLSTETTPKLAVIPRSLLESHVPNDSGLGRWKELEISFSAFKDYFVLVEF